MIHSYADGAQEQGKRPAPMFSPQPNPPLPTSRQAQKPFCLQASSRVHLHTFTESRGGGVQALLEGRGGVDFNGGAALGAAYQGEVDAGVHWGHHLQPIFPCVNLPYDTRPYI